MKTTRFLLTIIAVATLAPGPGYAAEPPSPPLGQRPHDNPATQERPSDPAHGNQARGYKDQMQRNHFQFHPNSLAPGKSSKAGPLNFQTQRTPMNHLHPSGLNTAATAAKDGLTMHKMENHREELARLELGRGATALLPRAVRDRAAAASGIGGAAAPASKNFAAAINGTGIKRKP
jgi:hypothetical protein